MMNFVPDLTLVYLPDQEFKAKHHVGNKGSFIVQAGGEARFEAGTQVVLAHGFTVENFGQFVAAVRPLTDCG